jgi:hypothetical protein
MRKNLKTSIWNNINHYVDNPAMVMKDLKTFIRKSKATPTDGGHTYHLQCAKCVVGYVAKFKDASLHFRVGLQHCNLYPQELEDRQQAVTDKYQAEFHCNKPTPLDRLAPIIEYLDKDLYYDLLTGKNTSILIYLNKTLLDWYYKKQSNETNTTSKSESVAAKAAIKKALDLRYTLRTMGNLVDYKTILCNDIATVITKSTIPNTQLERPNALATNFTQEAIATDMNFVFHVDGLNNPAVHKTEILGYQEWIHILKPVHFWQANKRVIPTKGE